MHDSQCTIFFRIREVIYSMKAELWGYLMDEGYGVIRLGVMGIILLPGLRRGLRCR